MSLCRAAAFAATLCASVGSHGADWREALAARIAAIDANTPGALGLYVHDLGDGTTFEHDADRAWYLASTVKVPVAIAVLEAAERGGLSLDETLVLRESDYVDGAGDLLQQKPGARYTIAQLIEKSIVHSDSTATDMLIRRLGPEALNRSIARWAPGGFAPLTSIVDVRHAVYAGLHPRASTLTNMDVVRLKSAASGDARLVALARRLGVAPSELSTQDLETAFERYYARGLNAASLEAFGTLLAKLVRGALLDETHTALLLAHMGRITTGSRRIQAGLDPGTPFAQKTGTQVERACNVGIVHPDGKLRAPLVVAACLERFGPTAVAERALADIGRALEATVLDGSP